MTPTIKTHIKTLLVFLVIGVLGYLNYLFWDAIIGFNPDDVLPIKMIISIMITAVSIVIIGLPIVIYREVYDMVRE